MSKEKFYITTPIYYLSGTPHLGTCSTSVYADSLARYNRMLGKDVFFLTGSDEHGQKVADKAKAQGKTPIQFVDKLDKEFKSLWKTLGISYDKYIRTTDDYHEKAVQKIFTKLYEKGEIYLSKYEGLYCTPCETFFTSSQVTDNKCPDCGRELTQSSEEAYFFKLSNYGERLLKYYEEHPDFIKLESTKNEMIGFIKQGLQDLCVSRTSVEWGIKVPFNEKHTVYVWIDALPNYLTALGYMQEDDSLFKKFWPADVHLMAKEIARFHLVIWPAILMALDLPLPSHIHAHGWLTQSGQKMGKSLGNGFNPYVLCERYGEDAVRYYLLKYGPILADAPYDNLSFLQAINSDLVNDIANLLSRTSAMIVQNFEGKLPKLYAEELTDLDKDLINAVVQCPNKVKGYMDKFEVNYALDEILKVVRLSNKYIEVSAPWNLKGEENIKKLSNVLHNLYFVLNSVGLLLKPFIPKTAERILNAISSNSTNFDDICNVFNENIVGNIVTKTALYQRLDIQKEVKFIEIDSLQKEERKEQEKVETNKNEYIEFNDFEKVKLKVGKIIQAERVQDADKLLKFLVDIGQEKRVIVSGVSKHYSPEEMLNKQVIVCTNLKPRKIRGIESNGMILYAYANDDKEFCFITPSKEISNGADVG